jgi:hypothetical protein
MKNEIAVTRRATYVAEESVSKLEKEKQDQVGPPACWESPS